MGIETFANQPATTVAAAQTAVSPGTVQTWTVASSGAFPVASTGFTQFHVADTATGAQSEIIAVTNVSGTTWTVTRGAESTTPVAHAAGFTITQVVAAGALTNMTQTYNVRKYGATGNGTTDDTTAIQAAINDQQTNGGMVFFPPGTYLVNGATTGSGLICAPGTGGAWTNATRSLVIRGSGIDNTIILSGNQWVDGGLFTSGSSGVNVKGARLDMADMTLDGNCNLNGGTLPQPGSQAGGLVNLQWPFTSASSFARNGEYHLFTRVRFYRPTGYGFQPVMGVKCVQCETLNGGQPSNVSLNYDNFGSNQGDLILIGHTFKDSNGNYADFVATTGFVRIIMIGCESYNHINGGIYACGAGSIITGNTLTNNNSGGGVGYDASTGSVVKSGNIVTGNVLTNIAVHSSGLSYHLYGDQVWGNISADQTNSQNLDVQGNLAVQNAVILGTTTNTPVGSPNFTCDGSNMYFSGTGAGGSRVYFRAGGYGVSTGQVSFDTSGFVYGNRFLASSGTPTIAAGAGAGSSPTVSVTGNDSRGTITVTTGTGPAAGVLATITFNAAYPSAPWVAITGDGTTAAIAQASAALVPATAVRGTTSFELVCNATPSASTTYEFSYVVAG